jgi:hypothetical protein
MSTYPPDGWEAAGTDVTWASDFDIQNGIGTITAIGNNGSFIDVTTSEDHGLEIGQWVRISGTTDYNGEYTIANVGASDEFSVTHPTYTSSQTGTYHANTIGPDCIKFENTTPTGNPYIYVSPPVSVKEGNLFDVEATLQATSIAGGNTVSVGVAWYDGDGDWLSTTYIHNAVLPSAGAWHRIAGVVTVPENARGAVLLIAKANTSFFVFVDDADGEEMPIAFFAYRNASGQNVLNATQTLIQFEAELYDYGDDYDESSSYFFTAPVAGVYLFSAMVKLYRSSGGFVGGGSQGALYIYKNTATYTMLDERYLRTGDDWQMFQGTCQIPLVAGDQVGVTIYHNDTVTLQIQGVTSSLHRTTFQGLRIH